LSEYPYQQHLYSQRGYLYCLFDQGCWTSYSSVLFILYVKTFSLIQSIQSIWSNQSINQSITLDLIKALFT
jgi:hypothetical protein